MPIVTLITTAVTAASTFIAANFTWAAFGGWLASATASLGLSAWLGKRQQKKAEAAANNIDTRRTQTFSSGPAQYPIGRTATGGVVAFWAEDWDVKGTERFNPIHGGADDAHMVIALGEGACDKIEGVFIGDDYFPVKFTDDAKQNYQRREQRDGDTDRTLMGLPLDLDPMTEAWFDVGADRWRKRNDPNAEFLNEDDDDDKEEVRRAALSGAVSIFPYLDASGSEDNYRSLREYTDDRGNSLIHGQATPFADQWTTDHKMQGIAGVHVRLRQWTKHKIGNQVFRGGVPQIAFLIRGLRITHPDPSRSSGSITQWTDNAAAVRYWWHTTRLGIDPIAIDRESFVRAYNICNETILPTKPTSWPGLTEEPEWAKDDSVWGFKKYSINGVLFADDQPYDIEKDFDMQWQGVAVEDGGKFYYFPGTDSPEADVLSINANDATELVSMGVAPSLSERFNAATISIDQSAYHDWDSFTLQKVVDQEKTDEVDGGLHLPTDIGSVRWINNPAQAYMLAIIALRRYRNSMTYRIRLPLGDGSSIVKYLQMTPGVIYNLNIPAEGITSRRVVLIEKSVTEHGDVEAVLMDSPIGLYAPTYQLPDIPAPPKYTPTKLGSRPITPANLRVETVARTSSDGSVHFQIKATVDANPLRVRFRLTAGDLVISQEVNDSTYTFDINVPRQQMELAAFHVDKTGMESIPARLVFTPDYRHIIMPTPRWNEVQQFGSNLVIKFEPEEFTAAVSGVEIRYTRLDLDTTVDIPTLTEATWEVDGDLLTTDSLQLVHGAIITANAVAPKSGRYNLYARYLSNVSGAEPVRGPISAVKEISIDVPSDSLAPGDQGFNGTMYNLDRWSSKVGATKGEILLLPSHTPASAVRFDNWNGNVRDTTLTTEPRPAWPFGRCVGYGNALDETKRNADTGLWDGDNATLYRTLPIDLGESKRVDVRAEVHSFSPGTIRFSTITFGDVSIAKQRWANNAPVPAIPFPLATGGTGQIVYSMEGLPAGLTFNPATRIITGTPAISIADGTAVYRAQDAANGDIRLSFGWGVNAPNSFLAPGRPNGVQVVTGVTSAVVSWLPGLLANYHRVEISEDNSTFELVGYAFGNSLPLPDLTAETTYYVRVRGENGRGPSAWTTPPISFTTLAQVLAPTTPTNFRLVDATDQSVLLNWNVQPNDHTFDVRWKLQTATEFLDVDRKTGLQINTVSVSQLAKNTSYHFQVRAKNSAGYSAWSTNLVVSTLAGSGDGPSFVSIEHISGERPHFKITTNTLPGETGTDISVQLIIDDDRFDTRARLHYEDPGEGPFLIYNVGIGRTYKLGIRKVFYPADGNNLRRLNRTTDWTYQTVVFTSVPQKMGGIGPQTNGIFAYSIRMQALTVLTATRYRVKYWKNADPENVLSQTITNPPSTGYLRTIISGLSEETDYSFQIQAYNSHGWGLYSDVTSFKTIKYQTTPAQIGGLEIYPVSSTEAVAIWEADDQASYYDIEDAGSSGRVFHFLNGDDPLENIHPVGGKLHYKLTGLVPGTFYTFRIRGNNPAAPSGGRYGIWASFGSFLMPSAGTPSLPYAFPDNPSLRLERLPNSRNIYCTFRVRERSNVRAIQIRYREAQEYTSGYVDEWQLIPNAIVSTASSGTPTYNFDLDPKFSRRDWHVQIRAYVSTSDSVYSAQLSEWRDASDTSFRNGRFRLASIIPTYEQLPESTVVNVEWDPHYSEFETPNGTTRGITENEFEISINGTLMPFKKGDYTNRSGGATPRYDGIGIFDAGFYSEGGTPLSTNQPEGYEWQGIRTRTARIGIHTVRFHKTITTTPNAGPFNSPSGPVFGAFLLDNKLTEINNAIQIDKKGAPFKFVSVGGYTNVDTTTTYYLAERFTQRAIHGTSSTRRFSVYTNSNLAKAGGAEGVFDLQGPADAYATSVLAIEGYEARELQQGDSIQTQIHRTDPYQRGNSGPAVSYTVLAPSAIPQPVSNTVRNIEYTLSGRDVIFTWDDTEVIGAPYNYEVSVIEDVPGEPLPSSIEGGDPITVRTSIEQDGRSTTFTKTGGRNELFTLSIRQYRYNQYGPAATYVYSPPTANNSVGKVYGFTADPVGTDLRFRWGQTDNADGYEISRSTDNGATWSEPTLIAGHDDRTHTYEAVAGADGLYRIRAYRGSASPYTYSLSYTLLSWKADTNPSSNVVEDIRSAVAISRNGSVFLDWTEADNADHYRIEYIHNGAYTLLTDNVAHGHTSWQSDVSDADDQTFRIRGEHTGLTDGAWTVLHYDAEALYDVPAPSVYTASNYRSIIAYWNPISGATNYHVQSKLSTESESQWRTRSNVAQSPFTITNLEEGTTYNIRVRASDGSSSSAWVVITTSTLTCDSFGSPGGLTLVPHTDKLRARWSNLAGANGYDYEAYVSTQSNSGFPGTPNLSGVATTSSPQVDMTLATLGNPSPPFYVRFRVRGKFSDCTNVSWGAYQTVRWEPFGIIVSPTSLTIDENGDPISVSARLASRPASNVVVTPEDAGRPIRASFSVTTMVFTPTDWDTAQTFTVSHVTDQDFVQNTGTINLSPSGAGYGPANNKSIPVTWVDQGEPAVVTSVASVEILETDNLAVGVTLKTKPSTDVTVAVTSTNTAGFTVTPASLTFTPTNYETAQNVTVQGILDNDSEDDTGHVRFGASGGNYDNVVQLLPVTIDDPKQSILTDQGSTMDVNENLTTTLQVKIGKYPNGYASVTVASSNHSAVTVSPSILNFNNQNWNIYQTVTLTGVSDADGSDTFSNVTLTGGLEAQEADVVTIRVRCIDAQNKNLTLSQNGLSMMEGGSANITARLTSAPNPNTTTTVTATAAAGGLLTVSPATRTFTTSNFSTAQNFVIRAAEDTDLVNKVSSVTFATSGGGYSASQVVPVGITNTSVAALDFDAYANTNLGTNGTLRFRLAYKPTGTVTVRASASSTNGTVAIVGSFEFTFTTSNWNTYQSITVSGSGGGGLSVSGQITLTANGGGYATVVRHQQVLFNVVASGSNRIALASSTMALTEGGPAKNLTLRVLPAARYRVSVSASPLAKVSFTATTDTPSTGRLSLPITARQDVDSSNETVTLTISAVRLDSNGGLNIPNATATVTIEDDDPDTTGRSLVISTRDGNSTTLGTIQSPFSLSNLNDRVMQVSLNRRPLSTVTVTPTLDVTSGVLNSVQLEHNGQPFTGTKRSISFTVSNWNSPQSLVLGLRNTTLDTFEAAGTINLATSGGGYTSSDGAQVTFTVTQPRVNPFFYVQTSPSPTAIDEGTTIRLDLRVGGSFVGPMTVTPSVSPAGSLTFDKSTYSVTSRRVETIRITAPQDADSSNTTATVTFTANKTDTFDYEVPDAFDLRLRIRDDDINELTLSTTLTNNQVVEGNTINLLARMSRAPTGQVTLQATTTAGQTDFVPISPRTKVVSVNDWNKLQGFQFRSYVSWRPTRFRGMTITASGGGWAGVSETLTAEILDDIGFEYRISHAVWNGTVYRFNVEVRAKTTLEPGKNWQFFISTDAFPIYASRIIRSTGTQQTRWASGQQGNMSLGTNNSVRISVYEIVGSETAQNGIGRSTYPTGYRFISQTKDIGNDIRNQARPNDSGGLASASASVEQEVAASTGREPAIIDLDSSGYEYIEEPVSNAIVRPYLDGIVGEQIWVSGVAIEELRLPDAIGGTGNSITTVEGLPAGVEYDSTRRVIHGTPTDAPPVHSYATIRLTDSNGAFDVRTMDWYVVNPIPASWSEIGGGFGQITNPFQIECATRGDIRPLFFKQGETNAQAIADDATGARAKVLWFRCPTTYPHLARVTGAADGSRDYDLVVKVGDEFLFSDTTDNVEFLEVPGHNDGALIGIYRYGATTASGGVNNSGDPITLEWVPTVIDTPPDEVGGFSGSVNVGQTNNETTEVVPGNDDTDIYVLHRPSPTSAWTRLTSPLGQGWTDIGANARQICFEFHFRRWDNRAVRSINTNYRDR